MRIVPAIPNHSMQPAPPDLHLIVCRPMAGFCRVSRFGDVTRWRVKPRKQD